MKGALLKIASPEQILFNQMNVTSHKSGEIDLLQSMKNTIEAFDMIQKNDAILVGVSGGPDSVALLHTLHRLSSEMSFRLGVAHLNHCLRGKDSDTDAEFVAALCRTLDVPYYTARENVCAYKERHKGSLEEAARHIRYAFYSQTAGTNGFNTIALGHHQDDTAEQVLMHLFRGSGPLGLSGIPPIRKLNDDSIKIIRPFIQIPKSQLLDFLKENSITYRTDKSNQDPSYLRNNIRNNLLPFLKAEVNPNIVETLNRFSEIMRSEEKWMDDIVEPLFEQLATRVDDHGIALCMSDFNQLPDAAQRRIIRRAVRGVKGDIRRMRRIHIDLIISLTRNGRDTASLDFPDRIRVRKDRDHLVVRQEKTSLRDAPSAKGKQYDPSYRYTIDPSLEPSNTVHHCLYIREINAHLEIIKTAITDGSTLNHEEKRTAYFDYDKLRFPLTVRNIRPGDRFNPLGMTGSQKVKKYFIDHKISKAERSHTPVLVSSGKIIWLVGHRIDDTVKVDSSTQNILKAELLLA